jgi:hypothetical protein
VKHFFARYSGWGIGRFTDELISPSEAIPFDEPSWNGPGIQARFRQAVDSFAPKFVVIIDAWSIKPLLAARPDQVEPCPRNQLAPPEVCCRCVAERARHSGLLHSRRTRAGWGGTQDYYARLGQLLNDAEAVLVLIPVIAAMLEPYSSRVRIVPWGMDTARFPWPVAEGPQAGETGRAAPGADGAGAEERPAVGPEGGVERPAPSATYGRAGQSFLETLSAI